MIYERDNDHLFSLSFCILGFLCYSSLACVPVNNVRIIKEEKISQISKS